MLGYVYIVDLFSCEEMAWPVGGSWWWELNCYHFEFWIIMVLNLVLKFRGRNCLRGGACSTCIFQSFWGSVFESFIFILEIFDVVVCWFLRSIIWFKLVGFGCLHLFLSKVPWRLRNSILGSTPAFLRVDPYLLVKFLKVLLENRVDTRLERVDPLMSVG